MKLIVGLGNPGKEYQKTRHNAGFMAVDHYLQKFDCKPKIKFNGEIYEVKSNNEKVLFLKPLSFMNASGDVVYKVINYFNISLDDILIIYDDFDFEVGDYKIKPSGSGGSHNGVKDVVRALKTENIKRIRIGISKNSNNMVDYVLGKFTKDELIMLDTVFDKLDNVIEDYLKIDFEQLMSKYN